MKQYEFIAEISGSVFAKNMPTSIRTYKCECGHIIDRDYNASINILAKGKGLTFVGEEWLHSLMNQEAMSFTA
jgi:hypothetical protein